MPTKKIADLPKICSSPDHDPPMLRQYEPGVYEHTCSKCGKVTRFTIHPKSLNDYIRTNERLYDDENPNYIKGSFEEM